MNRSNIKKHQTAIFLSNGRVAVVSLTITAESNAIGVNDLCAHRPLRYLSYETQALAEKHFNGIINHSVKNGSQLAYRGPQNSG